MTDIPASLLQRWLSDQMADVQTCSLGTVHAYYPPPASKVDVKLLARRAVRTTEEGNVFEDLPILPAVPLVTLGNDRSCLALGRPVTGDLVLVVFCRESPAEGFASRSVSDPADVTLHSLSGGFALPIAPLPLVVEPLALATRLESWLGSLLTALGAATAGGDPLVFTPPALATGALGSLEMGGR